MIVFDAGALLALERRKQRAIRIWATAMRDEIDIFVPGAVIAEWWRGRTDVRQRILAGLTVEPVESRLGRAAGDALAAVPGATVPGVGVLSV